MPFVFLLTGANASSTTSAARTHSSASNPELEILGRQEWADLESGYYQNRVPGIIYFTIPNVFDVDDRTKNHNRLQLGAEEKKHHDEPAELSRDAYTLRIALVLISMGLVWCGT